MKANNKKSKRIAISVCLIALVIMGGSVHAQSGAANGALERDSDGWTVITPSPDSKVVYVSSSEGSDANSGLSPEAPLATIEKAASLVREGYPDHILLKCGDSWEKPSLYRFKSGRSATEPMVISYYGDSIKRPLLYIQSYFINIDGDPIDYLAIMGLEFYGRTHDPNSPDFSVTREVGAFRFVGGGVNDILVEDCVFRYASFGAFHACCPEGSRNTNVSLRRLIITHAWLEDSYYAETGADQRISGFYSSEADNLLIEDCFFDFNGYDLQVEGAGPNMFNHNIYLQSDCNSQTVIRNCILARGSAHGVQLRGGGTVEDNFFMQNSVNVNTGGHAVPYDGAAAHGYILNNVFYQGRLMDSTNIEYPRTGANIAISPIIPTTVVDNIMVHSLNEGAVTIGEYEDVYDLGGGVTESGSVVYRWTDWGDVPDQAWFDPNRQLAHYNQNLGGEASAIAFLEKAALRPLRTLWPEYEAKAVNQFFRDGFSTDLTDDEPPMAPGQLDASEVTDASVLLQWSYGPDNQRTTGYNVYGETGRLNETPVNGLSYRLMGLSPQTFYPIWVKSVDAAGNESLDSVRVEFTTLEADTEAPTAPTGLVLVQRQSNAISLSWNPSADNYAVAGYKIYMDGSPVDGELPADTFATVEGLAHSTTYAFTVSALDFSANESDQSTAVEVSTVDTEKPGTPGNVQVTELTENSIVLAWEPSVDNLGVSHYTVFLDGAEAGSTSDTVFTLNGLTPGSRYSINVAAFDAEGNKSRNSPPLVIQSLDVDATGAHGALKLYPVPASGTLTVSYPGDLESIEILDLAGRTRLIRKAPFSGEVVLDVSALEAGPYLIRVSLEGQQIITRFLVD